MSIAVAVRHMMAAGMDPDAIVAAVAEMEAAAVPQRSKNAERQARYRERNKASQTVTTVTNRNESVTSNAPIPPSGPPKGAPSGGKIKNSPEGFDEWYENYPRREARGAAEKAYVAARKIASRKF